MASTRKNSFLLFMVLGFLYSYSYWYFAYTFSSMPTTAQRTFQSNQLKVSQLGNCTNPIRRFVYVKTHKTGSTTVHHAVERYTAKHSIKMMDCGKVTPFCGGYPGRFEMKFHSSPPFEGVNFHFRFNPEMPSYLPSDTKYFTIIREPWGNFQSSIIFYKANPKSLVEINCREFPYTYLTNGSEISIGEFVVRANSLLDKTVPWYFRFKNYQSHDLGLDPMMNNEKEIYEEIKKLESQLDLVMIMEYMDESLILLKDLFCADWDMILGSSENIRSYKKHSIDELTGDERRQFMNLQKMDIALYNHFNASFWKKIDEYGRERMENDLKTLRSLRETQNVMKTPLSLVLEAATTINEYERMSKSELAVFLKGYGKYSDEITEYMMNNSGGCFKYTDKPLVVS